MKIDWKPLRAELDIWQSERRILPLWWRDDDAITDTPELRKLLTLGDKIGVPVHLAVIPEPATRDLALLCKNNPGVVPVVHGWAHQDHAPAGQKKAEFGHPRVEAAQEALVFAGLEAASMDVAFFRASDPLAATIARHGLRFDLPVPEQARSPGAPGMDPNAPPKLR